MKGDLIKEHLTVGFPVPARLFIEAEPGAGPGAALGPSVPPQLTPSPPQLRVC